jgi:hypothetical protein
MIPLVLVLSDCQLGQVQVVRRSVEEDGPHNAGRHLVEGKRARAPRRHTQQRHLAKRIDRIWQPQHQGPLAW